MRARHPQQTSALVELLCASDIDFMIIGGVAAVFHGSARMTLDLDILMPFSAHNIGHLLAALRPHNPRHATRPELSVLDETIEHLLGFRLLLIETDLGRLDVLRGLEPFSDYVSVPTVEDTLFGHRCRIIGLDALIEVKSLVGRRKDIEVVHELKAVRERLKAVQERSKT